MRQAIERRPVVLALLAVVASLLGITVPGTAYATGSDFAMSQSSGQPGMTTVVSQVDPCPTVKGGHAQTVYASFVDASNTTVVNNYEITSTNGTAWGGSAHFPIPLMAASGTGTVHVWCTLTGQTAHTKDYTPQSYEVSGSAVDDSLSRTSYTIGEMLSVESVTACPTDAETGMNYRIKSEDTSQEIAVGLATQFNTTTGAWQIDFTFGAQYTDPATSVVNDTPLGNYSISVECYGSDRGIIYPVKTFTLAAAPLKYVAMGDSFSSGEGVEPFESGSNTPGTDMCHRSSSAYPRLLEANTSLSLDLGSRFVACSGAKTSDITTNTFNGEDPQIDALGSDTDIVTVTIGGNDVGFADYAIACTVTLCGPGTFDYDYIMDAINDPDFFLNLEATYESILTHAPNAQVYVSGYPFLAAEDSDVCGAVDLTGAWAVQDQLNAVTHDAVNDVRATVPATRLHYVDPNQTGSPFIGKHLCNGGASDFNGLTSPTAYSFHPNADGQEDFKAVFENAIS